MPIPEQASMSYAAEDAARAAAPPTIPLGYRPEFLKPLPPPPLPGKSPMSDPAGFNTGGVQLGAINTQGMDPTFRERLMSMIAASGGRLRLISGFRSAAEQQALWDRSDKTGKFVARPGHSNHEKGIAGDLGGDIQWAHEHAADFGLYFPMSWEPWHIEPVGSRGGKTATAPTDAGTWSGPKATTRGYTSPRQGYALNSDPGTTDPRKSLDYQMALFGSLLNSPDFVLGAPPQLPSDFTSMPVGTA